MYNSIGIAGKAGSGKDELTEIIEQIINHEYTRYAFADKLKSILSELYSIPLESFYVSKEKPVYVHINPFTHKAKLKRLLCRDLNTNDTAFLDKGQYHNTDDIMMNWTYNAYLKAMKRSRYSFLIKTTPRELMQRFGTDFAQTVFGSNVWVNTAPKRSFICSDVRFDHEADHIRSNGGTIIHLDREDIKEIEFNNHDSEKGVTIHTDDHFILNRNIPEWKENLEKSFKNLDLELDLY